MKKNVKSSWSHADVFADYEVRKFNNESERQIWEFMNKNNIPLTDEQRDELRDITNSMTADIDGIPTANVEDIKNWFRDATWQDAIEVCKDDDTIKDHFIDELKEEQRAEGFISIKITDRWKRDKLEEFLCSEIYPCYNEQVSYLQLY
jgi:hypothetical protein